MPKPVNKCTTTKFCGEYVEKIVEYGKKGKTKAIFCRDISIDEKTFYDWCETYPTFKKAWERAKLYAEAWWYEVGQTHLVTHKEKGGAGEDFDASLFRFMTAGRFGWRSERSAKRPAHCEGTFEERIAEIQKDYASNRIGPQQAAVASKLVIDAITVSSQTALMAQLESLERQMEELRNRPAVNAQYSPEPEYEVDEKNNE